ncbi:short-chain dehydrogenase/reductase SDR family protein [Pseudohyphozyma bogoriensis]|nr:short-chain dehydrogenase/reductase SDR family protein [Pseudohyphozyma bogoriensis]
MGNQLSLWIAGVAPESALNDTFFPPTSTYDPVRDIPDQTGKVVIVTGANTGIGYHTVKYLLMKNAKVYLAARSGSKAKEAIAKLKEETGKEAIFLQLDLSDLDSVKESAESFLSLEERLDILFNNAGVMVPPLELLTTQGYDLQYGTNVIAPYLLSVLLLPALRRATKLSGRKARIISTTSAGHKYAPGPTGIDYDDLKGGPARDANITKRGNVGAPWTLYGQSKFGTLLISHILDEDHHQDLVACAVHPGGLKSDLHRHEPWWQKMIFNALFHDVHMGAFTQLWGGTSDEGEGFGGKVHFVDLHTLRTSTP